MSEDWIDPRPNCTWCGDRVTLNFQLAEGASYGMHDYCYEEQFKKTLIKMAGKEFFKDE